MGGLVAAGSNTLAYQIDLIDRDGNISDLDWIGFAVAAGVVFLSFLFGGWVAGRMARLDGGINGAAVAIWFVLLVVVFAALGTYVGAEYNVFALMDLPDWMSQIDMDDRTSNGIIAAVVAVALVFLGAVLGGRLGDRYHLRADRALVSDRVVVS